MEGGGEKMRSSDTLVNAALLLLSVIIPSDDAR